MIGKIIIDRYEVVDAMQGGMGEVFICKDLQNKNNLVALKSYLRDFKDPSIPKLFIKEAKAWIKIGKGEFILSPERIEEIQGRPFIVMPFCKNGNLRDKINNRSISTQKAFEIITQIAIGMYRIGDKENLVHQDLKPENILFDDNNRVLISDLGIVRAINTTNIDNKDIGISQTTAGGTLPYTSPEQLLNKKQLDQRIDIYAIGLIFYEILTGEYAVMGNTEKEFYHKILKGKPPLLNEISSKFGKDCMLFIENCILKDRSKRPQNFYNLCMELDLLVKPGLATKKLSWWKKDNRIDITDTKTIEGWCHIFKDRIPDSTVATFKYTDIRLFEQAKDLKELGELEVSIKKCNKLFGNIENPKSNICTSLRKLDKSSANDKFQYINISKADELKTIASADVGLIIDTIELVMACYVDLIESPNGQKYINSFNQFTNFLLKHKNIPRRILILCAQAKIKSQEYDYAIEILSHLSTICEGVLLHKSLATYAVALNSAQDMEALVKLITEKTIPILGNHESNLAQKYCGQAIAMLNKSEYALPYFLKAYELDKNDLWSLNQAGICFINMGQIDKAKEIHILLNKISPNHPLTIHMRSTIDRVEKIIAKQSGMG